MKIEIEKKYEVTQQDLLTIDEHCTLVSEKEIIDYYLDDDNYTLFKNTYWLRIRNGQYELKIPTFDITTQTENSKEFYEEDDINKELSKFNLTIDDTTGVVKVVTNRKKYIYDFGEYTVTVDIDTFPYGSRYEIELLLDEDIGKAGEKIIDDFREEIGLTAPSKQPGEGKIQLTAMHENFTLYEIIKDLY